MSSPDFHSLAHTTLLPTNAAQAEDAAVLPFKAHTPLGVSREPALQFARNSLRHDEKIEFVPVPAESRGAR